jgi:hypothetical protein
MKGQRDKIVNNLRNLHPNSHMDDLFSAVAMIESDVTFPFCSAGYETEGSTLTAEGTVLQLRSVTGVNYLSTVARQRNVSVISVSKFLWQ